MSSRERNVIKGTIRANSALRLNKAAPTEANLRKFGVKTVLNQLPLVRNAAQDHRNMQIVSARLEQPVPQQRPSPKKRRNDLQNSLY